MIGITIVQGSPEESGMLQEWRYGGGAATTVLHPIVLVTLLAALIAMLWLPRRFRLPAFLIAAFFIPAGQQIFIGGVHFYVYRIIVLAGCIGLLTARRLHHGPVLPGGWNSLDTLFALFVASHIAAFTILNFSAAALINQAGYAFDYLGGYFLLRQLIRDERDINRAIRTFGWIVMILAAFMIREQVTGQNIFGLLGGIRAVPEVRDGAVRSQAAFQHAILAGTFGAILLPLFVWLWKSGRSKVFSLAAMAGSAVMAITSMCTTPLLAYGGALVGLSLWPLRRHMRLLRWGAAIVIVSLQVLMQAPVWALIARVGVVHASSSYHRYQLVDQFISHVGDWWLWGTNTNDAWGAALVDTSNAYVQEGVMGGILTLSFFIVLIARSFGKIGTARRKVAVQFPRQEKLLWLLGSALFANVVAFFGIYYFDQTRVAWLALLAMISAATSVSVVAPVKAVTSPVNNDVSDLYGLRPAGRASIGSGPLVSGYGPDR
jgi:hypothetical protein